MPGERPATRLWIEDDLGQGASLGLDHARSHFLRSVLRLSRGAAVAVFNGRDGEWLARIDGLGRGWASLSVEAQRRPQDTAADLWLVFAPIKRARLDFLVEKATELGCSALQPVMTQHTAVGRVNVERLRANAREAAEQCERLSVPEIRAPCDLGALIDRWPAERRLLACAEAVGLPVCGERILVGRRRLADDAALNDVIQVRGVIQQRERLIFFVQGDRIIRQFGMYDSPAPVDFKAQDVRLNRHGRTAGIVRAFPVREYRCRRVVGFYLWNSRILTGRGRYLPGRTGRR